MPRDKDVTAVLTEGQQFDVTGTSGFSVHLDGEAKTAMSSMELVLAGLAGCTGSDVISILRKKRQDVTGLEVKVHGRRAEEHPRRYTHIEITSSSPAGTWTRRRCAARLSSRRPSIVRFRLACAAAPTSRPVTKSERPSLFQPDCFSVMLNVVKPL